MKLLYGDEQSTVMKLLGKQNSCNTEYRIMNYCILKDIGGKKVVYNNFTKLLAHISKDEYNILNEKNIKYSETLDDLIKYWFLVPVDNDDKQICDQVLDLLSLSVRKDSLNNFVIFTTTDCNARCFYCFEHGVKREDMTEQTALDVCEYIKKNSNGENISIKWFGGEPLCNQKVIDIVSNYLNNNNIVFSSKMTSNGYLFNNTTILKAKNNWNLKSVQITLDGTEKVYNQIKNYIYKDCLNPFDKVINNISKLLESQIYVIIRLNVSDENRSDICKLVDFLYEKFGSCEYLKVYASNLYDLEHTLDNSERERLIKEVFQLNLHLAGLGYLTYGLEKWNNYKRACMAQNDNSVVITQSGLLGKCEHFSEGDKLIGSIYDHKKTSAAVSYWADCQRTEVCNNCIFYPNCIGITNCPCTYGKCDEIDRMIRMNDLENSIMDTCEKAFSGFEV